MDYELSLKFSHQSTQVDAFITFTNNQSSRLKSFFINSSVICKLICITD